MSLLPQRQWGVVVKNYKRLYGVRGAFATQLKALEAVRKDNPDDPAIRSPEEGERAPYGMTIRCAWLRSRGSATAPT